ncbi:fungal specific transcription factor factor domain protein [Fusarium beomiforme]|uniref:Fungal specific transcription factor factor domain protein n=1 Tax=Fusarium beomiforme TaxID=44412 RepID=A0A9P5A962_9HYPO|nr:fungal specific transcription factor factor domain protein [Fusarium beomiforme]
MSSTNSISLRIRGVFANKPGMCVFPAPGRATRHGSTSAQTPKRKQAHLLSRLQRLESVVEILAAQVKGPTESSSLELDGAGFVGQGIGKDGRGSALDDKTARLGEELGRLVVDENGSVYIGNQFWAAFRDEDLHAFPSQLPIIWQIYIENVDHYSKILHVPTFAKRIQDLQGDFSRMTPGMEALMFAITMSAINSMSNEDVSEPRPLPPLFPMTRRADKNKVKIKLHAEKSDLVARYRTGTEIALARADFINTTELDVIQAFSIFLDTVQTVESPKYVWSMAGLLARVAVSAGLHRDGSNFPGMSPFNIEMRRRLWWNILFIDGRSGSDQIAEASLHEEMFDTKLPTNANDTDLEPSMKVPPVARNMITDTTPILVRSELWRLTQRTSSSLSALKSKGRMDLVETLKLCRETTRRLNRDYFDKLAYGTPAQLFLMRAIRLVLDKYELTLSHRIVHSGGSNQDPPAEAHVAWLIGSASSILEQSADLLTEPSFRQWSWQLRSSVPWHALSVILSHICSQPWGPALDHAWTAVENQLVILPEEAKSDPLWNPVSRLLHEARKLHAEQAAKRAMLGNTARLPEIAPQVGSVECFAEGSLGPVAVGWNMASPGTSDDLILDTVDSEQWDAMMALILDRSLTTFAFCF